MLTLAMTYPFGFAATLIIGLGLIGLAVIEVTRILINAKKAAYRAAMIEAQGWPPAHIDGNGQPIERDAWAETQASEARIARHKAGLPD